MFAQQQGTAYSQPDCASGIKGTPGLTVLIILAWFQSEHDFAPEKIFLWKNGGDRGFSSYLAFESWIENSPQSSLRVFVLANFRGENGNAAQSLGEWLLKYIRTGQVSPPPRDLPEPKHTLGQFLLAAG